MSKFKPGDRCVSLVRTDYPKIVILSNKEPTSEYWAVQDLVGTKYFVRESFLVLEEIYKSPLYHALKEEQ